VQVRQRSDQQNWREEVSLRVNRHRARRHRTGDHASLELDFPADQALAVTAAAVVQRQLRRPPTVPQETVFLSQKFAAAHEADTGGISIREEPAPNDEAATRPRPRKIIRFPAQSALEARPPALLITEIELADPVPAAPRIMEAPVAEQMELLPSFADIHLEEVLHEYNTAGDLELPVRPAPLGQRLLSGLLDGVIVLFALGIFLFGFARIAGTPISFRAELLSAIATGAILWALFQYLFLVYGATTPGMRAAQIQLLAFDSSRASLYARRSRALASALSVISMGLGFAWALVDEDTLGWHDRISRTYMRAISK
jgi:uncharacterized RDD family membrane protein YckC